MSKSRRRFTAEFKVAPEAAKGLKTLNALCLISLLPALLVSTLILPIRGPKDGPTSPVQAVHGTEPRIVIRGEQGPR